MPDDAHFAPRRCLAIHPLESDQAADLLAEAADALLRGDTASVADLLICADMPALRDFSLRVMGKLDLDIHRVRPAASANRPPGRSAQRMPSQSIRAEIFRRDGYRCRFYGIRVVHPGARKRFRETAPHAVPEGNNDTYHAAFLALNATWDHVVPHSAGGDNEPGNLVTTCWPCNFGRGNYSLEQMGLIDPRLHPPVVGDWDGLSRLVSTARRPAMPSAPRAKSQEKPKDKSKTQRPGATDPRPWHEILEAHHPGTARPLLALIEACAPIGVTSAINKECMIRLTAGGTTIIPVAVTRTGDVELPWSIGPHKATFRPFAERIAASIAGAVARETPKTWTVQLGDRRKLTVTDLLAVQPALISGLMELRGRLDVVAPPTPPAQPSQSPPAQ